VRGTPSDSEIRNQRIDCCGSDRIGFSKIQEERIADFTFLKTRKFLLKLASELLEKTDLS
jgi:hypothetical protein